MAQDDTGKKAFASWADAMIANALAAGEMYRSLALAFDPEETRRWLEANPIPPHVYAKQFADCDHSNRECGASHHEFCGDYDCAENGDA